MQLETKRLKLREFKRNDAEKLAKLLNNIDITKYLAVVPHPYTIDDAQDYIESCLKYKQKDEQPGYKFAIEHKQDSNLIGNISIGNHHKDEGVGVLGYWVGEDYQHQGFMSEALDKVLNFGFDELVYRRIEALVYTENKASQKLLEKFKFQKEGVRRKGQKVEATGEVHDAIIYGLLRKNYTN